MFRRGISRFPLSARTDADQAGDRLQEKLNPRADPAIDCPPLLDTRNWQKPESGELLWAALRQGDGKHEPNPPRLASRGADERAAAFLKKMFRTKR